MTKKRMWLIAVLVCLVAAWSLFYKFYLNKADLKLYYEATVSDEIVELKESSENKQEFVANLQEQYNVTEAKANEIYENASDYAVAYVRVVFNNNSGHAIYDFNLTSFAAEDIYSETEDYAHFALRRAEKGDYYAETLRFLIKNCYDPTSLLKQIKIRAYSLLPWYGMIVSDKSEYCGFYELADYDFVSDVPILTDKQTVEKLLDAQKGDGNFSVDKVSKLVACQSYTRITADGYYLIFPYMNETEKNLALAFYDKNDSFICFEIVKAKEDFNNLPEYCREQIGKAAVDIGILSE